MPIMAIIALLSLTFSGNAWAIREYSAKGPSVAYVTDGDGKYVRCIKQSKELNGNCQEYEIRK
jgi:hypothetical protein